MYFFHGNFYQFQRDQSGYHRCGGGEGRDNSSSDFLYFQSIDFSKGVDLDKVGGKRGDRVG